MLDQAFNKEGSLEGNVVKGLIVGIDKEHVIIDVGLKSEGRIPLREFSVGGQPAELKVGDTVDVFLDRMEGRDGEAVLSREKAKREESWVVLQKALEKQEQVAGIIFGKVKGGFVVDLDGATAFLPGSQVDIRPVRDVTPLMGTAQPFQILKMDRIRGNIVVSRRAVLEESRAEARTELVSNLKEGQILQGIVKNITDYGAFVDLGGVDGLLHVTDIAWKRINHPSEMLQIGQPINVQVIKFNSDNQRISLGMKQLEDDPWKNIEERFPAGSKAKGRVTNITDYGAFVELEAGIEGLVHVSEMLWTKKNLPPNKIVSQSQEVEVTVLEIDASKRRISLGIKQCLENPWAKFKETHNAGEVLQGEIRNIAEFGLFVALSEEIDGMLHMSDLSWEEPGEEAIKKYQKGQVVEFKILDIDSEKERISLGMKQLTEDPYESIQVNFKKGDVVTCTISAIKDNGIEVDLGDASGGWNGFIKKADLARDRSEQRTDRFAVGEKVDAKVLNLEKASRKVNLSIKAREVDEDKKAMVEYGSSDSGASLGDILGAAIKKTQKKEE
ncbi:MAG: 30S ribosomal protein S1 [Alphaproteobacteria bacterium]|nr:30S ribosomal protein S1 [Alphaproteobacteria bacterium]MCL2505258.1 30S ribosomal protein S1 [Alphaproteobacteria bacterium]